MISQADTCRTYVEPRLNAVRWDTPPCGYTQQRSFTDGRIALAGPRPRRRRRCWRGPPASSCSGGCTEDQPGGNAS